MVKVMADNFMVYACGNTQTEAPQQQLAKKIIIYFTWEGQ